MTSRSLQQIGISILAAALMAATGPAAAETQSVDRSSPRPRTVWLERYQEAREGPEQVERFSRTVKVGRAGSLDVSNIAGDIIVSGTGKDEITIDATKRVRTRDETYGKQMLQEVTIEVVERAGRLEVRTGYPRRSRRVSVAVDYTIKVPPEASVTVKSISGDVRVTSVKGELRVESVSGSVHAGGANRLMLAKSVSGDVDISGASTDAELSASSVSGNLTAKNIKARSLDLGTVSGDVMLTEATCDRAHVRSVSGGIEYGGTLAKNGRYELNSHSGDVRLLVGENIGFELEASTFSGNVRSDLPLTLRTDRRAEPPGAPPRPPAPPPPPDTERSRVVVRSRSHGGESRSIVGTYGDGSALIVIRTFSGNVVIAKR